MKNNICSRIVVPPRSLQRLSKLAMHVEHQTDQGDKVYPELYPQRVSAAVCGFHSSTRACEGLEASKLPRAEGLYPPDLFVCVSLVNTEQAVGTG